MDSSKLLEDVGQLDDSQALELGKMSAYKTEEEPKRPTAAERAYSNAKFLAAEEKQKLVSLLNGDVVDETAERIAKAGTVRFGEGERYDAIKERSMYLNKFEGMRTGISYFDEALMGIRTGEVTILAGATGLGKTMVTLNVAASTVVECRKPVLFVSLEMKLEDIEERLYSIVPEEKHGMLREFFHIQENRKIGVAELEIMLRDRRYSLVVVDHLQFLSTKSPGRNEYEKIAYTTDKVHDLALTYRVPIFMLSHMNREGLKKTGMKSLYDLKGAGNIETDADNVFILNRDMTCIQNHQLIISVEKCRKKFVQELFCQYMLLSWEGTRLKPGYERYDVDV